MLNDVKPTKLVILGGGTSGWITAALLDAVHNRPGAKAIDITLVETAAGRIGVGEATVPTLLRTLQAIGIDEKELFARTDATFKQGIKFKNWVKNPADDPHGHYYHPFEYPKNHRGLPLARAWAERFDLGGDIGPFADACGVQVKLMEYGRAPKRLGQGAYDGSANYAYHLDAEKLGDYLAELCVERGVKRIVDKVSHVDLDERGWITALVTEAHGRVAGDLFIDCSGFQGLLINQTLGVPFRSFSDILLCDHAVAMRVPSGGGGKLAPYTQASAKDAGWIWDIHLQSRQGTGFVYSSQFISDDAAERTLRDYVGPRSIGQDARLLSMRVGCCREFWKNNCIAIGLAAGCVEPLESTGIALIEFGVSLLGENFPFGGATSSLAAYYNRVMTDTYNELLDFINLHYWLSRRDDTPFWKAAGSGSMITDSLKERLAFWSERPPREIDASGPLKIFSAHSWDCILYGMGWRPHQWSGMHGFAAMNDFDVTFEDIKREQKEAVAALPDHGEFLRQYR